jgi:MEMO1 family protein
MNEAVREAAVAGQFYSDDPASLKATIRSCLDAARVPRGIVPKALIVPHAGYCYSAAIAACGYRLILPLRDTITRVVLLGPSHRVPFRGVALTSATAYRTPLGLVRLEHGASEMLRDLPQVHRFDEAHRLEHSLEVQLPFLQVCLKAFKLIPLVVGDAAEAEVAEVLGRLWGGKETLIVVSSDLSHYLHQDEARLLDEATCCAIEELRPADIGHEQACGSLPIKGLLRKARDLRLKVVTLDLRNSGDTAGPRDQVVGYGSYAFYE